MFRILTVLALLFVSTVRADQTPAEPHWAAGQVGNHLFVAYLLCQLDSTLSPRCQQWDALVQGMYEMALFTRQDLCLPDVPLEFPEVKSILLHWLKANTARRVQPLPVCLVEALREFYCFY